MVEFQQLPVWLDMISETFLFPQAFLYDPELTGSVQFSSVQSLSRVQLFTTP